ncbi:GYF-like protein [Cynara cardunculus var. scolymus]|uniref:GYF-like protein n=1 Tax=Cynara cardunculus var. scolymus TaxID=59895 RepID=A0A103XK98_CYNCS|nr:GYF-like protein [Cynara cardunculus var. scolymus]
MEPRNSAAESQTSDNQSQPIQELDGDGGSKMDGAPVAVDVVVAADADGGGVEAEVELGSGVGGAEMVKKKRGRPPRVQAKSPPAKMNKEEDEDVCFICFDGGSLVLCDRRGCPKAYHPACVKRDEAFFRSKAKWNCGWHICSRCQKAAHHMCYTCTYSLCKGCIKKADYVCVRDKGFCTVCMKTIMLIENDGQGKDEKAQVDFDDKTSWEYLFKVYWVYLKGKLSLTLDELTQAKSPSTGASTSSVTPSTCVHNGDNNLKSNMLDIPLRNLEASESKRRKTDEQIITPHKETVSMRKLGTDESSSVVACKDWATKELLDFVAHMKNGEASVLSQFDVQELMLEYIKRNNLRDPRKKSQIICDSRLKTLFGKPRVGHFEMLKLLEYHFFIKEDLPKNTINSIARQVDPDWNSDNMLTLGKDKKRKNNRKGEERPPQNKLDEYAAIDVHNMNLIYLRRKLMENLIEDSEAFHGKVVGSIVRIRISGSDQKHDMYRLVQVVGISKADAPYKIGDKSADDVLEVLNLDKKETVLIDTISNQDLSEDECRRLRQSIKCGLVKRFTVGEIQEKAVSLQSVRLNDWMEAEILRLNNLRDRAKHKKPKYSGVSRKNTNSLKKRAEFSNNIGRSWKNEQPESKATGRLNMAKDGHGSGSLVRPKNPVECNGSTINNRNHRTIGSSPLVNPASETATSYSMRNTTTSNDSDMDKVWHYRDPSGKVQGPFCMIQLQKWSTTGYFPVDMRIWMNREDESLLLSDVLKEQSQNSRLSENKTATDKVGNRIEGLTVRTANLLSTEKLPDDHGSSGQSSVQNWSSNGNILNRNVSNESTGQLNTLELASPTPVENDADIKRVSSIFDISDASLVDLPSPTPKKTSSHEEEKVQNGGAKEQPILPEILVQDARNFTSDQDVGGAQLLKTANEWSGYSPIQVKREEWNSGGVSVSVSAPQAEGDHVATTTSNIEQIVHLPPWNGVRETIEFSTLAEESVSDLLAEVDAMESQNGFPSPTSRRNGFVEDLFNGSFEEFSPTPDQSARSDGFSSIQADIQLPYQTAATTTTTTTAATDEHSEVTSQGNNGNVFDFVKSSPTLQPSFICPETKSENPPFKWPEMLPEAVSKDIRVGCHSSELQPPLHDVNNSAKDQERESGQPTTTKPNPSPELVPQLSQRTESEDRTDHIRSGGRMMVGGRKAGDGGGTENEQDGSFIHLLPPPPPPSLAIGFDKVYPRRVGSEATLGNMNIFIRPSQETVTRGSNPHLNVGRGGNIGWDPHQRMYGGERHNNNSPRERSYTGRQPSFGGGSGGGGGYLRPPPPPKGQRVCKFYESGRCKKGASCNYWHPLP